MIDTTLRSKRTTDLIVLGASVGGLSALQSILSVLPAEFPLPIAIVLHRNNNHRNGLAHLLQDFSALPVQEAEDKQPIFPGQVYLAPADYHLLVEKGHFALSIDELVNSSRPAIDLLFKSAADAYGAGVIGIILNGANQDGSHGIAAIKRYGGLTIAQDTANAEARVMPSPANHATQKDWLLPLDRIGPTLVNLSQKPHSNDRHP